MTVNEMREWVQQAASRLSDANVAAVFAQGPRLGAARGSSWISLTSPSGAARFVRDPDGSGHCQAMRHRDGVAVVDERHSAVDEGHLDALVVLLTRPARPIAGRTSR